MDNYAALAPEKIKMFTLPKTVVNNLFYVTTYIQMRLPASPQNYLSGLWHHFL